MAELAGCGDPDEAMPGQCGLRPRTRSPSQWPGTAQLAASAGRWEMLTVFGRAPRQASAGGSPHHPPGAQMTSQLMAKVAVTLTGCRSSGCAVGRVLQARISSQSTVAMDLIGQRFLRSSVRGRPRSALYG